MKILGTRTVVEQHLTHIQCDKCGKTVGSDDFIEWQEFFSYRTTGGYGSIIGDMNAVEVDLCQSCFYGLLGPYMRNMNTDDEEVSE